ncbi:MAG: hypothetical protein HY758_09415 [Nitrospirae bacterium]|nr:hypothetical protein [Nitrospirota bacterium]
MRIANYVLIAVLLLSVLFFARNTINLLFLKKPAQIIKTASEEQAVTSGIKEIVNYAPILEQNPFGKPLKLIPLSSVNHADTRSPAAVLVLIGTVVGPENLSYAIFENKSVSGIPEQDVFAHGAKVYDFGVLTQIDKDWVEITRGSNTSKIFLAEPQTEEIQSKTAGPPRSSFAKKVGEKQYILDQQRVQQALKNPEQILTDARLLPNFQDGKQEGFKVSEVRPNGLYESLGIRNGDVLLRVNNLEISNPEVAMQTMSALGGMNTVSLDLIRNGARVTMSYDIR